MAYVPNRAAVDKAQSMIDERQYVLDSTWSDAQPSADEASAFVERHGWEAYGTWHLGVDPDAEDQTKGRFHFPYGDFRRVHRSGLIAAKQRAAQNDHDDVERAADELLHRLDDTRGA